MLHEWHDFYMLLGTASAALMALLFVAASIGASFLTPERSTATRTFMSPVVFHLSAVLLLSLVVLVPTHAPLTLALVIGIGAVIGFAYTVFVLKGLVQTGTRDVADLFGYGVCPFLSYAAALLAAVLIAKLSVAGPEILAGALLLLLAINIRNAWDLMLAFARRLAAQTPND
jgi:hypothetical protein